MPGWNGLPFGASHKQEEPVEGSTPQHYTVADFVKWYEDKELVLNPNFQRGSVWPSHARTYLIDSLLRGYPIPKLLLRTTVDRTTRRTVRDVVDGQQRLRTIFDFVNDKLVLGPKATGYQGKRYSDLEPDEQDRLLAYKLTCEQLINASDDDVLEVFGRINSYAVPVNEPELRNAQFDNEFSSYVKELAKALSSVWALGVLSERDRVRMIDQSLVAELVGITTSGLTDGAEKDITKIYETHRSSEVSDLPPAETIVGQCLAVADLLAPFHGEALVKRPHFLVLYAALLFMQGDLRPGRLDLAEFEDFRKLGMTDSQTIQDNFERLNRALGDAEAATTRDLIEFREARATTQRMKSRKARFAIFCKALSQPLD
ncbi:DUF262 domain-containing protein [Aeromicrobium sp. zg-636]|uniref:DUF262 domain-containing protein n=1 Tax=Aeromicrobium senzhongii TaxID=2663859 RepID=A0A8I0K173_9ACTN|nr:DUF262 domain-containing protein [Aeromicrobium sp. 636]MBC9227151.1 DUF262 domain-containing protein [Aeromicrobium senzhongii]